MTNFYPECQRNAGLALIEPTLLFKQQIVKAISCVVLFFILYVVLLLTAVALAVACISGGALLFRTYPGWLTGAISISFIVLGGMVLFFLMKFLFSKRSSSNPYRREILAANHPYLFDFIQQLVKDTRIRFPKKIFLVPDSNTSMFDDPSLLSLFWAPRKNLEIGIGLINSVNLSELKMLLAHEFAHFSKRSMKLGCYVYTFNKRLYNLLYENEQWNEIEANWQHKNHLFSFYAHITSKILHVIQSILKKFYSITNQQYLELSKEMEWYADTIAVNLSSTETAISGLRRQEMGAYCLDHCFHKLPDLAEKSLRFDNIFLVQQSLIHYYAMQHHLSLDDAGLPIISDNYFQSFLKSKVQLREQWTSHLTRESRETHFKDANITCEPLSLSAWVLFTDPEQLQQAMTNHIYELTTPSFDSLEMISADEYIDELAERHQLYEYPCVFNDYYDNRAFSEFNESYSTPLSREDLTSNNMATIYHPAVVLRMRSFYRDRQDAEMLQAISNGELKTKHFEFNGQKYSAPRAQQLSRMLWEHVNQEQDWLKHHDEFAFRYHYTIAQQESQEIADLLVEQYTEILKYQQSGQRLNNQVIKIIHCVSLIFNSSDQHSAILPDLFDVLSTECWNFKMLLAQLVNSPIYHSFPEEVDDKIRKFREQDCRFVDDMVPDYVAIQSLHEISSTLMEHFNSGIILLKKTYLDFILTLEPGN
ncbi:M48 family metallopeptidase [Chitinophaga silvatica]|nr:M48 family metallopeptidase [Chitinophaga silvatica]